MSAFFPSWAMMASFIQANLNMFPTDALPLKEKMSQSADVKWIKEEIDKLNDPELIELIKKLLLFRSKDSEIALNKALDEALDDVAKGRTVPHEEVRKKYQKRL